MPSILICFLFILVLGSVGLAGSNSSCSDRLLANAEECDDSGVFVVGYTCTGVNDGGFDFEEPVCFGLNEEGITTFQEAFKSQYGTCVCESKKGQFNASREMLCRGDGELAWAEDWNVKKAKATNNGFTGPPTMSFIATCHWDADVQDDCKVSICPAPL